MALELPGWGRSFSHRRMVAFGFGLVHGMGFYSALRGLEDSGGNIPVTLLGFNPGVEAGRLAAVAAVYPIIAWSAAKPWFPISIFIVSIEVIRRGGFPKTRVKIGLVIFPDPARNRYCCTPRIQD